VFQVVIMVYRGNTQSRLVNKRQYWRVNKRLAHLPPNSPKNVSERNQFKLLLVLVIMMLISVSSLCTESEFLDKVSGKCFLHTVHKEIEAKRSYDTSHESHWVPIKQGAEMWIQGILTLKSELLTTTLRYINKLSINLWS
jgi:hypothetical protein